MIDPNFDPLQDLEDLMAAVTHQNQQIQSLIKACNQQNRAIQNLNGALDIAKKQISLMELYINEINSTTTNHRPRR